MAVSFVAAGTAATGSNTSLTPGTPAGSLTGDFYVAYLTSRTAASGASFATPSGWTLHSSFPHTNGTNVNKLWIFWKAVASNGEAVPTFTYSGGSTGESVIGQVACFRGVDTSSPWRTIGTFYDGGNTANIGSISGISVLSGNGVLVIGHRADDCTSVATLTADTDSYIEIGEPKDTVGNDAVAVWDYLLPTANRTLAARTFTITGGSPNFGCGVFLEFVQLGGPRTFNVSPVTIPLVISAVTRIMGTATFTVSPVAVPLAVPAPTLVFTYKPAPVVITLAVPAVSVLTGLSAFIFTPAKEKLMKAQLDPLSQDWRVMLVMTGTTANLNEDAALVSDITTLDEYDGAGYSRKSLTSKVVTRDDPNNVAWIDADDVVWNPLGAGSRDIGNVVLYRHVTNDADSPLIACMGRGGVLGGGNSASFTLHWEQVLGLLVVGSLVTLSPLLTSLVAYWRLDEASGSATDSIGSNTLADTNTVTSNPGKVGTARQFTAVNSEYLSIADNAALSMGDIDFTIAAWVYFDTTTGSPIIAGKYQGTGDQREYALWLNSTSNRLGLIVSSDGTTPGQVVHDASSFGAISTGTWYFVVAWHDAAANTLNIQVNNGTVDSRAHSVGVFDGVAPFVIGSLAGGSQYMNGRIDEVGVWKRVLTAGERTSLYNGGSGTTYPFL